MLDRNDHNYKEQLAEHLRYQAEVERESQRTNEHTGSAMAVLLLIIFFVVLPLVRALTHA